MGETLRLIFGRFAAVPFFLDVLILSVLFYYVLLFFRTYHSLRILQWVIGFAALLMLSEWLKLQAVGWLLDKLLGLMAIAFVVLFQPELRRAVEKLGSGWGLGAFTSPYTPQEKKQLVERVAQAASDLSEQSLGGLIVFERRESLQNVIEKGVGLSSEVTPELIETIFSPKSPLHDGAVVIRGDRVAAAGCTLPLSRREDLAVSLGTRHRAAIGLTESTDALVLVVSEETRNISLAFDGKLIRNLSHNSLITEMEARLG